MDKSVSISWLVQGTDAAGAPYFRRFNESGPAYARRDNVNRLGGSVAVMRQKRTGNLAWVDWPEYRSRQI